MKRKIRVAQYGIGRMGSIIIKTLLEKDCELVAAFARNPAQIGRDAGEVAGIGSIGVAVSDSKNAVEVLRRSGADICIIATKGTMAELETAFKACCDAGVDALTIGEEAFWPWTSSPDVTARIDEMAKAAGVTVSGSGYPDVYWGSLVTNVAGSMSKLEKIHGLVYYDIDNYGSDFIAGHGVGLTAEEFENGLGRWEAASDGIWPCLPGDQNGWLCRQLGLTVTDQNMRRIPKYSKTDLYCRTTGETIPAGRVIGMSVAAHTATAEGVAVEIEVCGKLYEPDETDGVTWYFTGNPDTEIFVRNPQTHVLTCTTVVNRIPDVISAQPGFVTTDRMDPIRYMTKPMNEYVLEK